MDTMTDNEIIQIVREEFGTLQEFRYFLKYAKLSQAYAEAKARIVLHQQAATKAEAATNAELTALQQAEQTAAKELNTHVENKTIQTNEEIV